MFIEIPIDENHNHVLIAFGMGMTKGVDAWTWFLKRLKECLGICNVSKRITKRFFTWKQINRLKPLT